ncbi:CvpA family protein [Streptococcus catagoni]|uniref:CvpA family protein n=1 Tax=Streptococcus catagoni TaxID=2654874 RepID=UPI00140BC3A6|nr:CvpA family protein [Streptococcus catagoni]
MISIFILLIMFWNFYIGYNRGIILQTFYFFGALASLFVAKHYYQTLADKLSLWVPYTNPAEGTRTAFFREVNIFDLNRVFYAGVAFLIIALAVYAFVRLLGVFVHFLPIDYLDSLYFNLGSGLMSVLVTVIFLSMIFSLLATIPVPLIQNQLHGHVLPRLLIEHCPPMTSLIKNLWISKIL